MADDKSTMHNTLGPLLSGFGQFFTELLQFVIVEELARDEGGGDSRPSLSKSSGLEKTQYRPGEVHSTERVR